MMKEKELSRRNFLLKMAGYGTLAATGALLLTSTSCNMSSDLGTYSVDQSKCTGCQDCMKGCSHNAISFSSGVASISESRCAGCGKCVQYCKQDAISQS